MKRVVNYGFLKEFSIPSWKNAGRERARPKKNDRAMKRQINEGYVWTAELESSHEVYIES